jgi:CheY-like chemotaxis protein
VNETAHNAASPTQQLPAFCRPPAPVRRVVDVGQEVRLLDPTLRPTVGERIQLAIQTGTRTLPAYVDPSHLEQVIVNLAGNARDAYVGRGMVELSLEEVELEARAAHPLGLLAGSYVALSVADRGVGIPPEVMARVFEPFFTTKEQGTGLGLATAYGIVTQHGGAVEVNSREGEGSTFRVFLPLVDGPVEDISVLRTPRALVHGSGTVLLVEDDDRVRVALAEALRRYGYEVFPAKDGEQARRGVAKAAGRIDVIVSDIILEDGTGPELVSELRQSLPAARVVYVTGYASEEAWHRIESDSGATVLQKPFTLAHLLATVAAEPSGSLTPSPPPGAPER